VIVIVVVVVVVVSDLAAAQEAAPQHCQTCAAAAPAMPGRPCGGRFGLNGRRRALDRVRREYSTRVRYGARLMRHDLLPLAIAPLATRVREPAAAAALIAPPGVAL
jgi:hypothetical protein